MKILILLITFTIQVQFLSSQTYFGIGIGYDFAIIKKGEDVSEEYGDLFIVNNKNIIGGGGINFIIEQHLSKNSFLAISGSVFTRRDAPANWLGVFVPPKSLGLSMWQVDIMYKFEFLKKIYGGIGPSIKFNSVKINFATITGDVSYIFPNNTSYNVHFLLGYNYKHFLWELNFQKGLIFREDYSYFIKPIDGIGISMTYLFKMPNKKKGRKLNARF